jgi:hypothetical protein
MNDIAEALSRTLARQRQGYLGPPKPSLDQRNADLRTLNFLMPPCGKFADRVLAVLIK